jgi:hypothetical protein
MAADLQSALTFRVRQMQPANRCWLGRPGSMLAIFILAYVYYLARYIRLVLMQRRFLCAKKKNQTCRLEILMTKI